MESLKGYLKKHTVISLAIYSVLFAITIHILFKIKNGPEWLKAEWEAGDILTYVSTVALGLLALWQNKRFKEENDIAQARLEKLTSQANEIAAMNKIIEIESARLARLKEAIDDFYKVSDRETLLSVFETDNKTIYNIDTYINGKVYVIEDKLEKAFNRLMRELNRDFERKKGENSPFVIICYDYYSELKKVLNSIYEDKSNIKNINVDVLNKLRGKFFIEKEHVIQEKEKLLDQALYAPLTLSEVRKMYYEINIEQKNNLNNSEGKP